MLQDYVGTKTSNRSFTNHQSDEKDTDLIYMNARHQSPNYGIFISTDEVTDSLGVNKQFTQNYLHNPQGLNPYSYTQNDPVNKWDPDGREAYVISKELDQRPLGTHTFIMLVKKPENGVSKKDDFIGIYGGYYDKSGGLEKQVNNTFDVSTIKNGYSDPKGKIGKIIDIQKVQTPWYFTDDQFNSNIQMQFIYAPSDAKYDPLTNNGYNSNNLTTTILKRSGVNNLPWNGNAKSIGPGYGQTIPLNEYLKSDGTSSIPNGKIKAAKALFKYGLSQLFGN